MPSIGSCNVDVMLEAAPLASEATKVFERPGIDYYAAMQIGKRCEPVKVSTITFVETNGFDTLHASALAQVGQMVTITDQFGSSTTNVLVESLEPPQRKAVIKDGQNKIRVGLTFVLRNANPNQ